MCKFCRKIQYFYDKMLFFCAKFLIKYRGEFLQSVSRNKANLIIFSCYLQIIV